MNGVAVGAAVAVGGYVEVAEGVTVADGVAVEVLEGAAVAVALGEGFDGGITSTFLSTALVRVTRSGVVEAISAWTR